MTTGVRFKWKDYREKGRTRYKTMTLETDAFIRRFLLHILPSGFHRIRHYGLFANTVRVANLIVARQLLVNATEHADVGTEKCKPSPPSIFVCPTCASPMIIVEIFERGHVPRAPPIKCYAA